MMIAITIRQKQRVTRGMCIGLLFILFSVSGCKKDDTTSATPPTTPVADGTIQVSNPGNNNDIRPAIQTAVDKAVDGDVIVLPAGTFTFIGTIQTTKLISLQGAGRDLTTLYRPETLPDASIGDQMFYFNINRDTPSNIVISGITFKSKVPADLNNQNGSLVLDQAFVMKNAVDFIVTDCRFENFGFAGFTIYHRNNIARGVIYKNQFYHNFKGDNRGYGFGVDVEGGNAAWAPSPNFGTDNFIFIEDNTFDYHFQAINGNTSSLFVARYNVINNNWMDAGINMHESYGRAGTYPARAGEIYNNTINATKFGNGTSKATDIVPGHPFDDLFIVAISPKGGDALVYNNSVSGYRHILHVTCYPNYFSSSQAYPIPYNLGYNSGIKYGSSDTGYATDHGDGDGFFWNNTAVTYQGYTHKQLDNWEPTWLVEGRDYHSTAKPGYVAYTYPHPLRANVK